MIQKMFTVYDDKAGAHLAPFFMNSTGLACRAFTETANDPQSNICRHPGDYTLFEIGTWDDVSGEVTMIKPHNLGSALTYKTQPLPDPDQIPLPEIKDPPQVHHLTQEKI